MAMLSGSALAQSSPPFYINREGRLPRYFPGEPIAMGISYPMDGGLSSRTAFSASRTESARCHRRQFPSGRAVDEAIVNRPRRLARKGKCFFNADDYDPDWPDAS